MKILITGGSGLVGYALKQILNLYNHNFVFLSSKDCDLTDFDTTMCLFNREKPDFVLHLAANVGGLYKNLNKKVEMYEKNILINLNVLKCSYLCHVKKVVSLLSTCVFPDKVTYPITENDLHFGPPHSSNECYAYSKRMLELHSRAYNEQYGCNFICVIPTNIYGPNDNFNLKEAHVIPALIHKCLLAEKNKNKFIIKGSGKPLRQFIYSIDLAKLIMIVLEKWTSKESIILTTDEKDEVSIREIAIKISTHFNVKDDLVFDKTYSDGQYKKTSSNLKLKKLVPDFKFTSLDDGLKNTINWFKQNFLTCRK